MKQEHIKYLACPSCAGELAVIKVERGQKGSIEDGQLQCRDCKVTFDVVRHVPRFVPAKNYAASFGFEWNRHARTQYDSYTGTNVSEKRFFQETKWPRDLRGQIILEVGSGSGRFTEPAASTGAMVVSLDYSFAVDANYSSNGHKDNVLVVQADIYSLPLGAEFDYIFCIGVLHHLPDPQKGFEKLVGLLKPKSLISIWVYGRKHNFLAIRIYEPIRKFTRHIPHKVLYYLCYFPAAIMGIFDMIYKVFNSFSLTKHFARLIPFKYYSLLPFRVKLNDSFDVFSTPSSRYYTEQEIRDWFEVAGLKDIKVLYRKLNGVEKGIKGFGIR